MYYLDILCKLDIIENGIIRAPFLSTDVDVHTKKHDPYVLVRVTYLNE